MSEYWKSTPKYWCKHCSAYVKDTPFERKQHENTAKHQGNLKRFLRGIQNDHERNERDKERVKAEVDRLNKVVGGSGGGDSSATISGPSKTPAIRKSVPTTLTAADQKKQWAQLAEMGIQVPDSARAELAMPGQWQKTIERTVEMTDQNESLSTGVRKRKHLNEDEEAEAAGDISTAVRRGWGSTTKRYPGGDPHLDDLLSGTIIKKKDSQDLQGDDKHLFAPTIQVEDEETAVNIDDVKLKTEDGAKRIDLVKQESLEESVSKLPPAPPDLGDIPVFKKRKAKIRNK